MKRERCAEGNCKSSDRMDRVEGPQEVYHGDERLNGDGCGE